MENHSGIFGTSAARVTSCYFLFSFTNIDKGIDELFYFLMMTDCGFIQTVA